jgi:hypothetical protein
MGVALVVAPYKGDNQMYNASQVKYLQNLNQMTRNWINDNPHTDLENAMCAFEDETGIRPTFHPSPTYRTGYYSVTSEDLARVGELDLHDIP